MAQLHLIKQSSGVLIPASVETSDFLHSKCKLGTVLVADFKKVRNPAFHRRFFALLNLGFDYWEPTGGAISSNERKLVTGYARYLSSFGGSEAALMDAPAHTVTTTDHHGLVTSHLVMLRGTCRDGRVVDAPAPGLTAGGLHVGNVETHLAVDEYDQQRADEALAFLREYSGADSDGLVTVDGIVYRIVDIGMRMLQPHELYRAQGFPEWYIIDRDYRGVKYAKDKQVARCGNAVPPPFAEALVRANLPELCRISEEAA